MLAAVPLAILVVPGLAHLPAQILAGCLRWVGLAAALELTSAFGFLAVFALVFGERLTRRQKVVGGLRALSASTTLPGGSLTGPAVAAGPAGTRGGALRCVAGKSVAFALLTAAPGAATLVLLGAGLWLGWPAGPHRPVLTVLPAGLALVLLAAMWRLGRPSEPARGSDRAPVRSGPLGWMTHTARVVRDGSVHARGLVLTRDRRLVGAVAYYAFDNAVVWATFRAYGSAPPLGTIVMGYLVGSLGSAVPVPLGVGAAEGGLIGALVLYGAPFAPATRAVLIYRGISVGLPLALGGFGWACRWPPDPSGRRLGGSATRSPSIIRPRTSLSPRGTRAAPPAQAL
jgi:uncharacterized membrane protein YbhN (UPF0104 family)